MRTQKGILGEDNVGRGPPSHLLEVLADDLRILDFSGDIGDHQCPRELELGETRMYFHRSGRYVGPQWPRGPGEQAFCSY